MYRTIAIALVVIGIIGSIWYRISSLESDILELKSVISKKEKIIESKNLKIGQYKMVIKLKDASVAELTTRIEKQNADIESLKVNYNNDYSKWVKKSKDDKHRYVQDIIANNIRHMNETKKLKAMVDVNYKKGNCEDGKNLNEAISRIKYEDL